MSTLPFGKRVVVVGGPHFGRAGMVYEQPTSYPEWYTVRLDGGDRVLVAPNDLEPVGRP